MGEAKRRKQRDPNYGKFSRSQSEAYLKQGIKLEEQGEYEIALRIYSQAINCYPLNSEAYFARANLYDDLGYFSQAINDYSEHIKLLKYSFKGFNNRALVYMKLEQHEEAILDFEQAIELEPNQPCPYFQIGTLLWEQGEIVNSLEFYEKAAELYRAENNLDGYKICVETLEEAKMYIGLIRMAYNDPYINKVNWDNFLEESEKLENIKPKNNNISFDNSERVEYFKNYDFYAQKGGAFEEILPRTHIYRSVKESELFKFIQASVDNEEEYAKFILSKVNSLLDLTEISDDLLKLIDKSIIEKRNGNLNQAFKFYNQVFENNQTWYMLWYGMAKLLCLFREYRMAFACIKICTYLYSYMNNGRSYHSDHHLSYHYDQIYSLAIAGDENESYLKTLGRPLNTININSSLNKAVFKQIKVRPKD